MVSFSIVSYVNRKAPEWKESQKNKQVYPLLTTSPVKVNLSRVKPTPPLTEGGTASWNFLDVVPFSLLPPASLCIITHTLTCTHTDRHTEMMEACTMDRTVVQRAHFPIPCCQTELQCFPMFNWYAVALCCNCFSHAPHLHDALLQP